MQDDLDKIKSVRRRHEKKWLANPNVLAVGIGLLPDGRTGIVITVRELNVQVEQQFPSELDGIGIRLQQSDEIRAL